MLNPVSPLPLKDPTLFRQANYLDGKWVEADSGQTIVVKNPATGEAVGEVPNMGVGGNAARDRGGKPRRIRAGGRCWRRNAARSCGNCRT